MPKIRDQNKLTKLLQSVDIYGDSINFQIEGNDTFNSKKGGIVTMLVIFTLLVYASLKFKILHNREDTNYQTREFIIDKEQIFSNGWDDIEIVIGIT